MKNLFFLITVIIVQQGFSQNHIIVQGEQHVIYYKYEKENIVFVVEDLKDNEDNFTLHPQDVKTQFVGGPYLGTGILCGQENSSSQLRDMCFVEFDSNQNGIADNLVDCGYTIPYYRPDVYHWRVEKAPFVNHSSCVMPYYIELSKTTQQDFESFDNFCTNGKSMVKGSVNWTESEYKQSKHVIWVYSIPWDEIITIANPQAFVRFQIHRVSSFTGKEFYGSIFYPSQNTCNGTTFHSFKLSMADCPDYKEQVKVYNEKKSKRINTSQKLITSADSNQPEWDGVYLQLKNGKYLPLSSTPLNIAAYKLYQERNIAYQTTYLMNSLKYDILKNRKFYFLLDQIDLNSNALLIKKEDIKGIFVVASNSDPTFVSKASFSMYNPYQLDPDGYEILYPLKFPSNYDTSCYLNFRIQRDLIYLQGESLPTKRLSYPNNKYLFILSDLKKGVYSFWLNGINSYIFEITG
jgi:hypothetical protein